MKTFTQLKEGMPRGVIAMFDGPEGEIEIYKNIYRISGYGTGRICGYRFPQGRSCQIGRPNGVFNAKL